MSRRLVSPTLVGRDRELEAAKEDLARAAEGRVAITLVGGEAGIGKTRLAEAVLETARSLGFTTMRGACVPIAGPSLPYGPIAEAFRGARPGLEPAAWSDAVGEDGPVLARISNALGSGSPPDGVVAAGRDPGTRAALFEAVLGFCRRLATPAPVLLVLEDLQWADTASLDLIAYLTCSLRATPFALLLTFRSDDLPAHHALLARLAELERLMDVDRIELSPLQRDETAQLVAAIRNSAVTSAASDAIHVRSGGNPFFIEELLIAETDPRPNAQLAPSLRDILEDRIGEMPTEARAVLGAIAVAGPQSGDLLVEAIAGLPERALVTGLHAGLDAGLLLVSHDGQADRYAFRHPLIGEVVYEGLLATERRRMHEACARALANRDGGTGPSVAAHWSELAYHWQAAGDLERAFGAAARAGAEAELAFAFGTALARYEQALSLWDSVDDPSLLAGFDHLALLRRTGWAAHLAGNLERAAILARQAVAEADQAGDDRVAAVTRAELGYALWMAGEPDESESAFRAAVAMMPPEPPSAEGARVLAGLAQVLMNTGRLGQSLALCDQAIELALAVGDRATEGHASNTRGVDLGWLGRCGEAVASFDHALTIAVADRDADEVGRVYTNLSEVLIVCDRGSRAREVIDEGLRVCEQMGSARTQGLGPRIHAALAEYELGRWDRAAAWAREARLDLVSPNDELYLLTRIVDLAVARGDWAEADDQLRRIAELLARYPVELQYTGPYATARVELALWRRDPRAALDAIDAGITSLERTDDRLFRVRLLRLGMRAAADLAEMRPTRNGRKPDLEAIRIAETLRGRVARQLDAMSTMDGGFLLAMRAEVALAAAEETRLRGVPTPSGWREAADLWQARERPYLVGYARWREAEASLRLRNRRTAGAALAAAAAIAGDLGAEPLLGAIERTARRARLSIQRSAVDAEEPVARVDRTHASGVGADLTVRELEVLGLVARGLTDRQIADALFVSRNTVGVHVSRILGKLGVSTRTEAASVAYRTGLVEP